MMLGFLLAVGTGCSASLPQPNKPAATEKSKSAPVVDVGPANSEYEKLVENGALTKLVLFEPEIRDLSCLCLPTGEFNVAPTGDHLLMETWCVGDLDDGKAVMQVEDEAAPSFDGKPHFFNIPFERAVVSVTEQGGETVVTLHYRDEAGQDFHVDLPARAEAKYAYNFADLVPDTVWPHSERRTIPIEVHN